MKILFVLSGNNITGGTNIIKNQAKSLAGLCDKIDFFLINGKGLTGYLRNIISLRKHLMFHSYDIIHAHYGLCGLVSLLAKRSDRKLVVSLMGNDLLGDHAKKNGGSTLFSKILVVLSKMVACSVDIVIVKSEEMAKKIPNIQKEIIPNGVDLEMFKSIEKRVALRKTGWSEKKQHVLFLSSDYRPEKNIRLAQASQVYLKNSDIQFHLLENIEQSDLIYYYNSSDVCLLTSYHEGSPNVIKEAMACNRPIVSTNVGDVEKNFGELSGHYLCTFTPSDVADKIQMAIQFSQIYGYTRGRERIEELGLDSISIAKRINNVYLRLLDYNSQPE